VGKNAIRNLKLRRTRKIETNKVKTHETTDRRRAPRVNRNISLRLTQQEFDSITETKNLSCNGTYCSISKYIEPLTKLKILLLLPNVDKKGKNKTHKIKCNGIVVRTEESGDSKKPYNVAIYFNEIKEKDKEKISLYVNHHLRVSNK